MDEILIEALEKLTNEKRESKQFPIHISDVEFKAEVTRMTADAVKRLWREKRVKLGRTINNNYIELQ